MKICVYMRENSALHFQKQKLQERLHVSCGEKTQRTLRALLSAHTNSLTTPEHPQPESQGHDCVSCSHSSLLLCAPCTGP